MPSFACIALMLLPLAAAACGDGAWVVLGDRDPAALHFATPRRLLTSSSSPYRNDNPSLTADQLELYFTSERGGTAADIWRARRNDPTQPFGAPELVPELSSQGLETSPVVSADGLRFWLASDRAGGLGDVDIWGSTRASRDASWAAPQNLSELNSAAKDIPRPPGQHGLVMPMASDRDTRDGYQIYFATRPDLHAEFAAPMLRAELLTPSESSVDGFLSEDGLRLFFVRGPATGAADLFVATRRTPDEAFEQAVALDELNSPNDERDPFLAADGRTFYFSSDRSGFYEIYVTELSAP